MFAEDVLAKIAPRLIFVQLLTLILAATMGVAYHHADEILIMAHLYPLVYLSAGVRIMGMMLQSWLSASMVKNAV